MSSLKGTAGKTAGQGGDDETTPSPYEDTFAHHWEQRRLTLTVLAVLAGIILALGLGRALIRRERSYAKAVFKASVTQWNAGLQRFIVRPRGEGEHYRGVHPRFGHQ